ncbi:pantoate kinase [Halococcus saccharolyticus]|uniref:Pantoate kinase n=1 Tax=Halococcus saccharolyticus DSM 5350 TaxID=1227455 RepID=M0MPS8_9EURY|nr:GHMP kinase [Halococcus saccharolyticus]EMA46739.1 GHMP kinase [Halococcus saccharolyticus DSM 5350]
MSMSAGERSERTANPTQAFVPGHVTGFFSVHPHDDPRNAGSRGAGLALTDGVTVTLTPANETAATTITLGGESVEMAAVTRTLDTLDVAARVAVETPLPVSAGFGVSGGAALGAAFAANACFDLERTENELVEVAHAAEVAAGTGLGDVVAQARGGVPLRLEPGAPPHGALDGIPVRADRRIEYVSFGGRSTEAILSGDTDILSAAGERALATLREAPTLEHLVSCSAAFAREAELLTERVDAAIAAVEAAGGAASMAMLGETVFALDTGLSDAGYEPSICAIHPPGAGVVRPDAK